MKRKRHAFVRLIAGILFLGFTMYLVVSHVLAESGIVLPGGPIAQIHQICPFGGVETLGRLLLQGRYIPKTGLTDVLLLVVVLGGSLILGPLFCGWLCPLGSVQDWVGKLGKRIFGKRYNRFVPPKLDKILGSLRYVVLAVIVLFTTLSVNLVFQELDPYYALMHFWTGEVLWMAIAVLGLVLVASLFVERPWCRWFCPLGALQGLAQRVAPWTIRRDAATCTSCGACSRACPMRISVDEKKNVRDTRCNSCAVCVASCPVPGALSYSLPKRKIALKSSVLVAVLALVVFLVPQLFFPAEAAHGSSGGGTGGGEAGAATAGSSSAGSMPAAALIDSADDVRGSMTLQALADGLGMGVAELYEFLGIDAAIPAATALRDMESLTEGLSPSVIRDRVAPLIGSTPPSE